MSDPQKIFEAASLLLGGSFTSHDVMLCVAASYREGIDLDVRPKLFKNRSGESHGRLQLFAPHPEEKKRWIAKCNCGTWTTPFAANVMGGRTVSCGCRMREAQDEHRKIQKLSAAAISTEQKHKTRTDTANRYARSEKGKKQGALWRERNREAINKAAKEQRKMHSERYKAHTRHRRAKLKNIDGRHSHHDVLRIGNSQSWLCNACGCNLKETGHHVDHVVPISKGGTNWPSNLQLLCRSCNVRKSNKSFDVFMKEMGQYQTTLGESRATMERD